MSDVAKNQGREINYMFGVCPAYADDASAVRKIELLIRSLHNKGLRIALLAAIQSRAMLVTR
jgi:hypothetical protein